MRTNARKTIAIVLAAMPTLAAAGMAHGQILPVARTSTATLRVKNAVRSSDEKTVSVFLLILTAKGYRLTSFQYQTRLRLTVGDRQITYTGDDTKEYVVPAEDQDYSIRGSSVLFLSVVDRGGRPSRVRVVQNYNGEGTIRLSSADAGSTRHLTVGVTDSKIVMQDSQAGEAEMDLTCAIRR